MFHIYTFGTGSKQFLILTPKQAKTMDEFTQVFFDAQKRFLEENGRRWTPEDAIHLVARKGLIEDYNKLSSFANRQHWLRNKIFDLLRIDVKDEEMDDFLVRRI